MSRIILVTNSTSKVIPAIRSRCLSVRVPAPTHQEIATILTVNYQFISLPAPTHQEIVTILTVNYQYIS